MGNGQATVSAGNKAQADKGACEWFRLVDLHGGGELIDLIKAANASSDYSIVDEAIQRHVRPFLYDGGRGRLVRAAELRYVRSCYRQGKEPRAVDYATLSRHGVASLHVIDAVARDVLRLENGRGGSGIGSKVAPVVAESGSGNDDETGVPVCWDLYRRGPVGETILHMCLLQATAVHADLAKRLLHNFPTLLVDIYTSDQYYGETALHMAIVNEDPAMVKVLLSHDRDPSSGIGGGGGAVRLHERRCCGEFFCAEDQKRARHDHARDDSIVVPAETNYAGYVYWGEYALSFAACLGQEECVRLLVASGAQLDAQDFNGNTALHMTVVRNRKDMYELLRSLGADTTLKNRQGLTPLALAAKLARKEMYDYILEKERQVFWTFGDVMCAAYPLADVDTIDDVGAINTRSVLDLIVHGGEELHLEMVEGVVVHLLVEKWRTFVKWRFYRRLLFFFCYFIAFAVAMGLREVSHTSYELENDSSSSGSDGRAASNSSAGNDSLTSSTSAASASSPSSDGMCYSAFALSYASDSGGAARAALDISVLLGAAVYIVLALREVYHHGWRIFAATLKYAPAKTLFLVSCVAVLLIAPSRLACTCAYEDVFATIAMLCTAPYFLFFCRGIKIVGPFVVMIYKMVVGDFVRFLSIYVVFVFGFSQSLYVVFLGYGQLNPNNTVATPFAYPHESFMGVFYMSSGQFGGIHGTLADTRHHAVGIVSFTTYMIIVTILVINMFIAMMGNTYKLVNEAQKEWLRQWANIVLVLEQTVTPDERLLQRRNYSQPLGDGRDGRRALVVRWRQSAEEQEAMKEDRAHRDARQLDAIVRRRKQLAAAAAAAAAATAATEMTRAANR